MTPIAQYTKQEDYVRLLLQGPPGAGKTTLACQFPKAMIVDIDVNLAGPLRYLEKRNMTLPIGYDRIDLDKDGKPIGNLVGKTDTDIARQLAPRYDRLNEILIDAQTNDEIQTIVLDSATGLADVLMAWTNVKQNFPKDGRQLFGFFLTYGKQLINTLVQMRKHVVLIAHEKIEQDQMTQLTQYRVAWPGQLGDYIGSFFTNVWRCEVVSEGFPPKYKYMLRTMQDAKYHGLKNNYELPPSFQFDWNLIQANLKK